MPRTIIFGDIHGCYEEWQALLEKTKASPKDRLISVGDIVCKGPSTKKTLDLALQLPNLMCVMGNHEHYLLRIWQENLSPVKDYQREVLEELGSQAKRYMKFIASWPYYLDLPECLVIHAGIRPGIPLKKQSPKDLVSLRTLEPDLRPWYTDYTDPKLIVHGHWAKQGLVVRKNVIGLDTGCVYGKSLTAVILPERKIVSVPAKRAYAGIHGKENGS